MELQLRSGSADGWHIHFLSFPEGKVVVSTVVQGMLANAFPTSQTGKTRLLEWKRRITVHIYSKRGSRPLDPRRCYSVSLGMRFFPLAHQKRPLDPENFIKPVLDGIAAGPFCPENVDPRKLDRFDFDDSNFRYLFVERLPDGDREDQEGVAITVSQL